MGQLLLIGTLILAVLTLVLHGYLRATPGAALLLLLGVVLIALGGSFLLRLLLFSVALYLFAKAIGTDVSHVLLQLSPLFLMLVGFYIMFRGIARRR